VRHLSSAAQTLGHHSSLTWSFHLMTWKVSLDDLPAPETRPAPMHTPIPACTSASPSISSPTHATASQLSSAIAPAVQVPPSITSKQKLLEITTPCLLNSRGATTKVPRVKTSSCLPLLTHWQQTTMPVPFFPTSTNNIMVWLLLLTLPITGHHFQPL